VRTETMTLNMGPQHPSTHGVLRLVLRTDGEIVSEFSSRHLVDAFLGGGVGVSLFHYGMPTSSLREAMQVFVALIEARVFTADAARR